MSEPLHIPRKRHDHHQSKLRRARIIPRTDCTVHHRRKVPLHHSVRDISPDTRSCDQLLVCEAATDGRAEQAGETVKGVAAYVAISEQECELANLIEKLEPFVNVFGRRLLLITFWSGLLFCGLRLLALEGGCNLFVQKGARFIALLQQKVPPLGASDNL